MTVSTPITQEAQLRSGSYSFGSGKDVLLFMGSCRSVPYLNYLHYVNAGDRFKIHFIDPYYYHYDLNGGNVDFKSKVDSLEEDSVTLDLLKSVTIFVHEYYQNYGMFNTDKRGTKNIYQFGLSPKIDITIPNFNNIFILFQDFISFDSNLKERARQCIGDDLIIEIKNRGFDGVDKFVDICKNTDLPEMADVFLSQWKSKRFFWNINHVSNSFTMAVFKLLSDKFFKFSTTKEFWERVAKEDMYSNPHTPITRYDVESYGLEWEEPIKELRL